VGEFVIKRLLDLVLSIVMLILALPLIVCIMLAIKLEDGGPVFYRQERWGLKKKKFQAYKFRTMDAASDKNFGIISAKENDFRITRVGRILRSMGLDELPQIINIMLGQMSFVGPRSLAVDEIIKDKNGNIVDYQRIPGFEDRLNVRPGLTSVATIYIPKDSTPDRKFRYDLFYVRRQSLWLDIRLILLSFWISFRGKWETRKCKV
jgi:lipopolysaccharide/colanic/teichoic acid biosynthesis glycosyltransferase